MGVGDGAARVVVEMRLDIAAHDAAQGPDQLVHLAGGGHADGVRDTDAVHANPVDGLVKGEEVDKVGAEGVLGGEADLAALAVSKVSIHARDRRRRRGAACLLMYSMTSMAVLSM